MVDLFRLTDEHAARLQLYFPKYSGRQAVYDRHVLNGNIFVGRNRPRWRHDTDLFHDALHEEGRGTLSSAGRKILSKTIEYDKRRERLVI